MNHHQRLEYLLQRHLAAEATEEEQKELFALSNEPENEASFRALLEQSWQDLEGSRPQSRQRIPVMKQLWFRVAVAAAAMLVITFGVYQWVTTSGNNKTIPVAPTARQDIGPGKDGAILTLADGRQMVLDSAGMGIIAREQGVQMELRKGQLVYQDAGHTANADQLLYHTMATPKGRQFQLKLPDGTLVWLNAASSIRFPAMFPAHERKVEITGEAYFEVAKEKARPFRVVTTKQEVVVTGTQFNVNSYYNEPEEKTTLLEGTVQVSKTGTTGSKTLLPAEQALITPQTILVNRVNTEQVMAWKNGFFYFVNADIPTVMRYLERWYDIDVRYEGNIPVREFAGKIQRDLNLSEVLNALERLGVHFRLEGERKLVVTP